MIRLILTIHSNKGAGNNAPFALKPYRTVLNTTNKRDAELYNQAVKPFDIKYDGSETTFYNFLNKIKQRARHLMCESIYEIEEEGTHLNLFDDYVRKSLEIRDIIVCCFLEIVSPRLI